MLPVTTVRTIVAPGASGAKETIGVGQIKRTREDGSQLVVNFDPPRRDLLDVKIGALSDREIEQLGMLND